MQRKALGILGLLALILVAIGFGYWDMLNSEKLRVAQEKSAPVNVVGDAAVTSGNTSNGEPQPIGRFETAPKGGGADGVTAEAPKPEPVQSAAGTKRNATGETSTVPATAPPVATEPSAAPRETTPPSTRQAASDGLDQDQPAEVPGDGAPRAGRSASQASDASPNADSQVADAASNEPNFDILRVEPSGETVVAGNARPNAMVAMIDGGKKIGEAKANSEGQFALALDAPLKPGEHSISLQATDGKGPATASRQTAIVSVPQDGRSGQVLAMIDSPDGPSRIVEMPKADGAAGNQNTEATADVPTDIAKSTTDGQGDETQLAMGDAAPDFDRIAGGKSDRAKVDAAGKSAGTDSETDDALSKEPAVERDARAKASASPSDDDRVAMRMPNSPDTNAATSVAETAGPSNAGSSPTSIEANEATKQDSIAADREASAAGAEGSKVAAPLLRVEAVELQGETISVAGAATSGAKVRVYVDNALVAEDDASRNDRFLASGKAELSIGRHLVRADQLNAGGDVVARAEVPFDRPEGERVAAIASAGTAGASGSNSPVGSDAVPDATVATTATRHLSAAGGGGAETEIASVAAPGRTNTSDGNYPARIADQKASADRSVEAPAIGRNTAAASTDSKSAATDSSGSSASGSVAAASAAKGAMVDKAEKSVRVRPAASVEAAQNSVSAPSEVSSDNTAVAGTGGEVVAGKSGNITQFADSQAQSAPASVKATTDRDIPVHEQAEVSASAQIGGVGQGGVEQANSRSRLDMAFDGTADDADLAPGAVNRQAALTPVEGRVIIRRGDTLWQISRETYGAGRRYTVIYFANGQQIRNPDLIYPGQVFRLPSDGGNG